MTTTAEQELEAAIWISLTKFKATCDDPIRLVTSIKRAAIAYAAGDSEALTALRREVLHRESAPGIGHSPASDCGGGRRTATEPHPPGSVEGGQIVPPGGATTSTARSIPDSLTSKNSGLSTC